MPPPGAMSCSRGPAGPWSTACPRAIRCATPTPVLHPWKKLKDLLRGRPGTERLPQRVRLHGPWHAHPAISEAIKKRCELDIQFALPTEGSIIVAEHLAKNFCLPKWRLVNSGSKATMDAIRITRAVTGREQVMKIFGSYHGHRDYVMVSLGIADWGDIGERDNYKSVSYGAGIPKAVVDMTAAVPFNDAPMMEARTQRLTDEGRKPACGTLHKREDGGPTE
jgi:hypothetical protein